MRPTAITVLFSLLSCPLAQAQFQPVPVLPPLITTTSTNSAPRTDLLRPITFPHLSVSLISSSAHYDRSLGLNPSYGGSGSVGVGVDAFPASGTLAVISGLEHDKYQLVTFSLPSSPITAEGASHHPRFLVARTSGTGSS